MNSVNLCLCPSKKAVSCLQSRHVSFRLFGKTKMPLWTSPILTASPSLNPFVSSPTIPSKVASVAAFLPDFVGHSLLYLQAGRRGRMGPQYSGSSTPNSNSKSVVEYPSWHCYCGFTTHAKPASTWKNFSRMFYGCPNYKNHGCSYFEWCDPQMCIYGRRAVNKFRDMHVKIESEVVLVRRREKMLITAVGVLAVLLFGVNLKLVIG